jgi:hypothetical protein
MVPDNTNGQYNIIIRSIGCNLLFTSVVVLSVLVADMDRYQSYLLATTLWYVEHLGRVLNQEASTNDNSDVPNAVMVVFLVLLLLGFCLEGDWPGFTAKVMVSALSFFGLGFAFLTKFFFCQVWRTSEDLLVDPKHSSHRYFLGRVFGLTMMQSALFVAVFQFGEMDIVSAFGISCGFLAISVLVLPLVSTKAANMGIATRHVFMAVVCAVATLLMLLGTESGQEVVETLVEAPVQLGESTQE